MIRRLPAACLLLAPLLAAPVLAESLPETVVRLEKEVSGLRKDLDALNERLKSPAAVRPALGTGISFFLSKGNPFVRDAARAGIPSTCRFNLAKVTVDEKLYLDEGMEIRRVQLPSSEPAIVSLVAVYNCDNKPPVFCSSNDVFRFTPGQQYEVFVEPGSRIEECKPMLKAKI